MTTRNAEDAMSYLIGRARYEKVGNSGRFLVSSIVAMPQAERDAIEGKMVAEKHRLSFQAGSQEHRIACYVLEMAFPACTR